MFPPSPTSTSLTSWWRQSGNILIVWQVHLCGQTTGVRLLAVWRRPMQTSAALTPLACWALVQVIRSLTLSEVPLGRHNQSLLIWWKWYWHRSSSHHIVEGDINAYAAERKWQISGGRLQFRGTDSENEEQGVSTEYLEFTSIYLKLIFYVQVPSVQLANMAITYAREMEQIV